jgi:hypothetical protein
MIPFAEICGIIWKRLGTAVAGPKALARMGAIATLSVADTLLTMIDATLVTDIRRVKESLIRRVEARTATVEAAATKKLAEAIEAADKADLPARKDAIARATKEKALAEAAKSQAEADKSQAEADKVRSDIEIQRLQPMTDARVRLLEAITKLRAAGGDVYFDADNLKAILAHPLPLRPEKVKDAGA